MVEKKKVKAYTLGPSTIDTLAHEYIIPAIKLSVITEFNKLKKEVELSERLRLVEKEIKAIKEGK